MQDSLAGRKKTNMDSVEDAETGSWEWLKKELEMKICKKCKVTNPDEAKFCRGCGVNLDASGDLGIWKVVLSIVAVILNLTTPIEKLAGRWFYGSNWILTILAILFLFT